MTRETNITEALLLAPEHIATAAAELERARQDYERRLNDIALKALNAAIFPGRKEGEPERPAANDAERKLAIQKIASADKKLRTLRQEYKYAQRQAELWRNRFKTYELIARLEIAEAESRA